MTADSLSPKLSMPRKGAAQETWLPQSTCCNEGAASNLVSRLPGWAIAEAAGCRQYGFIHFQVSLWFRVIQKHQIICDVAAACLFSRMRMNLLAQQALVAQLSSFDRGEGHE